MTAELTKPYEEKMKKTIAVLESDYATIRAGRANPHVLDKIMVDYYGTPTPVNQVGNVTVPEARLIQIQPWDTSTLKAIEKAINMSDLGINPNNDGKVIRLVFPELTEERRKELNKDVKKKAETAKVDLKLKCGQRLSAEEMEYLRKNDPEAYQHVKSMQSEQKQYEDKIQKLTDKFIADIDKKCDEKCKDILAV